MDGKEFYRKLRSLTRRKYINYFGMEEIFNETNKNINYYDTAINFIKNNLNIIIPNLRISLKLFNILYEKEELQSVIKDNIVYILFFCDVETIEEIITDNNLKDDLNEEINNNFGYFLNNLPFYYIYYLYLDGYFLTLTEENHERFNEYLEENKYRLASLIIKYYIHDDNYVLNEILVKLIEEICECENVKFVDIKKIGGDYTHSSKVFLIGNKVLKVGQERDYFYIPNDKRILKPLIRIDLKNYSNVRGTIEVANKVDTETYISDEDIYKLDRELRDRGIVFIDIKRENIGYLLYDNDYNWNKSLADIPEARGLIGQNSEVLKKGELVIIDTDYIFKEENISKSYNNEYETRYNFEKIKKI